MATARTAPAAQVLPAALTIDDGSKQLMVTAGRASRDLGVTIAGKLGVTLIDPGLKTFSDGEVYCRYTTSIRGADLFIVQSICDNEEEKLTVNDALMELMVMVEAAKGASARRVIAVTPWYGYARQDKKSAPREPITARLVARMLETAGVDRVVTMDLHSGQVQGFFTKPVDHMTAMPVLAQYLSDQFKPKAEIAIMAPDAGRAKLARRYAQKLGVSYALLEKNRPEQQKVKMGHVIGDVRGKSVVIVDDMIDTGGTLAAGAQMAIDEGAVEVFALATHGVFSGNAYENLRKSPLSQVIVTDTLPARLNTPDFIHRLTVSDILTNSIRSICTDGSVSEIFAGDNQLF